MFIRKMLLQTGLLKILCHTTYLIAVKHADKNTLEPILSRTTTTMNHFLYMFYILKWKKTSQILHIRTTLVCVCVFCRCFCVYVFSFVDSFNFDHFLFPFIASIVIIVENYKFRKYSTVFFPAVSTEHVPIGYCYRSHGLTSFSRIVFLQLRQYYTIECLCVSFGCLE